MRIVVTGATGNIGSALLRRLSADGGHHVIGVARRVPAGPTDGVDWVGLDLSDDACALGLRSAMVGADAVVHLAWGFQPSHDQDYLLELGVGGTRRVIEAVTAESVPHLVHLSSIGAYSPGEDSPVDESWPTDGVPTSWYSRSKVGAERLLDQLERSDDAPLVTRLRPGIVGQHSAGSALLRYGVPALIPHRAVRWLPVLPLDRGLRIPLVHSDDVADAIVRSLEVRAGGAFNLAADPPVAPADIASALGARHVHVPAAAMRPAMAAAWHGRLQQVDPGWLDLGMALPLLDCSRAREVLGWTPSVTGPEVLREVVDGLASAASDDTPVLRPRSVLGQLGRALRHGVVSSRRRP